ncbi:MAG: TSUP family transporter [Rhodobacteraceae bacterium]|nr:TSUP family transporter [Paracoccaceae bacterium]
MDVITLLIFVTVAFLLAGTVKGVVGMGLPTTAIGLMTLTLDPRSAIAIVLMPMITLNAWQVWRSGDTLAALRRYAPFITVLMIGVALTSVLSAQVSNRALMGLTGIAILIFVAANLSLSLPRLPDRLDRRAQVLAGLVAGVMGGLTAVWVPPLAIYLTARQVDKAEFVRASGLLIFLGSLPLAAGYVAQGLLGGWLALLSAAMILPGLAGFTVGERLRNRLSPARFRMVMLLVFLFFGLNLIRRAWF